jgi:hypothetical protein
MKHVYRILVEACWAGGLLSLLAAFVLKFIPGAAGMVPLTPRGAVIFASALFLCTLATKEMEARTA